MQTSVSLRSPIARAAHASRITAPGPSSRRARQSSGARGIFVPNGHRSANGTRPRHVTSELHQIRMRDDSVGDIDGKIIGRIASASLRHENKVPGSIVRRARLGNRDQGNKTSGGHSGNRKFLQDNSPFSTKGPPMILYALLGLRLPS